MSEDFDFLDAISSNDKPSGGARCPNCGQEVSKGAVLCIGCGFNLRGGEQLATARGSAAGGGMDPTMKIAAIGGAGVVLILLGLGVMMMSGGDDPPARDVATAPTPTPKPKKPIEAEPAPLTEAELAAKQKAEEEAAAAAVAAAESAKAEQERMRLEAEASAKAKAEAERLAREEAARLAAEQRRMAAEKARLAAEKKFQESIDKAKAQAQAFLLEQFDQELGGFKGNYSEYIGESALATYALLKSGVDPNDERVTAALKNMIQYAYGKPGWDKRGTYNCGIVMLALDELRESYARMEKDSASSSSESADARRNRLMIKGAMRKLALGLNRNQQTGKSFSYGGGAAKHGHDMSIHQYALLGMWAAYRSGVKLVPGFWEKQVEYLMALQHEDGAFSYKPERPATGTMTTAGVGSLAICYLMLHEERLMRQQETRSPGQAPVVTDVEPETDLEKAIAKGFEWIAGRGGLGAHDPYYIYGLERMCALTQTKTVGDKDWYRTIAPQLVRTQQPDGSWVGRWGPTCSTAWNLLFLTKGTEKLFDDPIYENDSPGDADAPVIGEGQKVDQIEERPEDDPELGGEGEAPKTLEETGRPGAGPEPVAPPAPGNPTAPGVNPGGGAGPPAISVPKIKQLIPDEIPDRTN